MMAVSILWIERSTPGTGTKQNTFGFHGRPITLFFRKVKQMKMKMLILMVTQKKTSREDNEKKNDEGYEKKKKFLFSLVCLSLCFPKC